MDNPKLLDLLSFKLPCGRTFTDSILPEVLEKVYTSINEKLIDAEYITLISDIWTNRQMHDFMGLAACITSSSFKREMLVLGMMIMPGNHCAENIQEAIEKLVNKYDFDSTKIIGNNL